MVARGPPTEGSVLLGFGVAWVPGVPGSWILWVSVLMHGPKPYEFIGFGDIHGPKTYEFVDFWWSAPGEPFLMVGREVPHLFDRFSRPPGPPRLPKSTMSGPSKTIY